MKARWISLGRTILVALVTALAVGCGGTAPTASISADDPSGNVGASDLSSGTSESLTSVASNTGAAAPVAPRKSLPPEVVVKTTAGDFRLRLNSEKAPLTVENFLENYVDRGFYSNTIFHHVDPGYILAGGYTPELEAKEVRASIRNEASNGLKNVRGTITMSRDPEFENTATSQFFINVTPAPSLDYDEGSENLGYCVFGEVVEGMEVVDRIAKAEVHDTGDFPQMPVEAIVITSIERVSVR